MRKWLLLFLTTLLFLNLKAQARSDPIIWLAPLSTITFNNVPGSTDYMSLFTPNAPWKEVAKSISVFKLYPSFVGRASDSELRLLFADLKQRNIAIALEARVLSTTVGCNTKVGDGGASTINLLRRIRRLGGELSYVAMDEPLKHGLLGKSSCRATFDQIAADVVENVRKYRAIFPNLQIGDIEPIGSWVGAPSLIADTVKWVDAYKHHLNEALAFFHSDVGWKTDWIPPNLSLRQQLKKRGVPFGIIYNSDDPPTSDEQWAMDTEAHFTKFERLAEPDQVVFQTWRPFPTKVLPESDPLSLTGVVKRYLEYRAIRSSSERRLP